MGDLNVNLEEKLFEEDVIKQDGRLIVVVFIAGGHTSSGPRHLAAMMTSWMSLYQSRAVRAGGGVNMSGRYCKSSLMNI